MILKDRHRLAEAMKRRGLSQRGLRDAMGWESHTYIGRLLRGETRTLKPGSALRMAVALGVGVDHLFLPRTTTSSGQTAQPSRTDSAA